jgi:hypothetical protein
MLSTQKIYLDKSAVDKHRKLLHEFMASKVKVEGRRFSKEDSDAMFFGATDLHVISVMKLPLHMSVHDLRNVEISMDVLMTRDKSGGDAGYGKSSIKSRGVKVVSFFSKSEGVWHLVSRPRMCEVDSYSKWNLSVSRPNSINDIVDRLELGGGSELQLNPLRHLITNRVSRRDSFVFGCINMYFWLQKCILFYSAERHAEYDVYGRKVVVSTTSINPTTALLMFSRADLAICADNFTDKEMMILSIAMMGHESVMVRSDKREMDIYSGVITRKPKFDFFTFDGEDRTKRIDQTLLPPEIALKLIYNVVEKLGVIGDWLSVPQRVKGMAMYKRVLGSMDGTDHSDQSFFIDAPSDSHYSTLLEGVCSNTMFDTVEHTNLGASSACLILEACNGYALANNIHYTCECLGLLNTNLFPQGGSGAPLYRSYMLENDLYAECEGNKLVAAMLSHDNPIVMSGNVRFFSDIIDSYVDRYSEEYAEEALWLQINLLYGRVLHNNSSDMVGSKQLIDGSVVGPIINDPEKANRAQNWLTMHYLADDNVFAGGLSKLGFYPLPEYSEALNNRLNLVKGEYACQLVELSIANGADARVGYDSRKRDDLWYTVSYFSQEGATGVALGEAMAVEQCCSKRTELGEYAASHRMATRETEDDIVSGILSRSKTSRKNKQSKVDRTLPDPASATSLPDKSVGIVGQSQEGRREAGSSISIDQVTSDHVEGILKSNFGKHTVGTIGEAARRLRANRPKVKLRAAGTISSKTREVEKSVSESGMGADAQLTVGRGVDGDVLRFCEVQTVGDGNCGFDAMYKAASSLGYGEAFIQQMDLAGWKPDGQWQDPSTLHVAGQLVGLNVNVYTVGELKDGDIGVTKTVVEDPAGTVNIKYKGNHFTALIPADKNWDTEMPDIDVDKQKVMTGSLQPDIAQAYNQLLRLNGMKSWVEHDNDPEFRKIEFTGECKDKLMSMRPIKGVIKTPASLNRDAGYKSGWRSVFGQLHFDPAGMIDPNVMYDGMSLQQVSGSSKK